MKKFPIADIVSLYTNKLLCQGYKHPLEGYMYLALFIADRPLHSIEVVMHNERFKQHLSKSYPWLNNIEIPSNVFDEPDSKERIKIFIQGLKDTYGDSLEVNQDPNILTSNIMEDLEELGCKSESIITIDFVDSTNIIGDDSHIEKQSDH